MSLTRQFILGVCKSCPHGRFIGGTTDPHKTTERPREFCVYHADQTGSAEARKKVPVDWLLELDQCPDELRRHRAAGAV